MDAARIAQLLMAVDARCNDSLGGDHGSFYAHIAGVIDDQEVLREFVRACVRDGSYFMLDLSPVKLTHKLDFDDLVALATGYYDPNMWHQLCDNWSMFSLFQLPAIRRFLLEHPNRTRLRPSLAKYYKQKCVEQDDWDPTSEEDMAIDALIPN